MNQNKNMQTYVSPSGWYSLLFSNEWRADNDEDCVTFSKEYGGIGALQISAYKTTVEESAESNLLEYLGSEQVEAVVNKIITKLGITLAFSEYKKDKDFTKIWFITKGFYLLFVTYNCDWSNRDIERTEISNIVESIQISNG